jgi:hypothetical protein
MVHSRAAPKQAIKPYRTQLSMLVSQSQYPARPESSCDAGLADAAQTASIVARVSWAKAIHYCAQV